MTKPRRAMISLAGLSSLGLALLVAGGSLAGTGVDSDGDGVADSVDNCTAMPNSSATPGHLMSQQDTDKDGFGNRCDADFNNNGVVNGQDTALYNECLGAVGNAGGAGAAKGLATASGVSCENMDLNDNGVVNGQDSALFNQLKQAEKPGPSGHGCASTALGSPNLTGAAPCVAAP